MQSYGKYSKIYQKSAASTLDQRKLIIMMYKGAVKFLSISAMKMREGKLYEAHTSLVRGKSIIVELMASLDLEKGGDIASNLQSIYIYIFNQLIEANVNKDAEAVEHVVKMLKSLCEAWQSIDSKQENSSGRLSVVAQGSTAPQEVVEGNVLKRLKVTG